MRNKSAKEMAFEREKLKLQKQKRQLEEQLIEKNKTIKSLEDTISELQSTIVEKEDWIERLLEYTELSKEDIEKAVQKDKEMAKTLNSLNAVSGLIGRWL